MAPNWRVCVAVAIVAVVACCPAAWALDIGDRAPAIAVKEWVSNTPVSMESAKGKVLIVEFWATWCGPCKVTIPHLNKLHAKHKDKGVVIVSITREDAAKVKAFLAKTPMHYHVGIDDGDKTSGVYMKGVRGIPHAVVVDRTGKVVWKGHPMMGMDMVVSQLVAGTFDPEKVKKLSELREKLKKARSYADAYAALDAMIAAVPDDPGAYRQKRMLLGRQGKHDDAQALLLAMAKACSANASVLAEVAGTLATAPDVQRRDMPQALEFASKAVKLSKGEDAEALDALARVHYELGHLAKAIATADKAAAAASGDEAKVLKARAAFYRAEQARRRKDPDAKL